MFLSTHTHTHNPFNSTFSGTTQVSRYQKGKTNLDFTEARDSERQWHQLGHMQVFTSLQTDNHASYPTLSFLQAGRPSCRPTDTVKALKAFMLNQPQVNILVNIQENPTSNIWELQEWAPAECPTNSVKALKIHSRTANLLSILLCD